VTRRLVAIGAILLLAVLVAIPVLTGWLLNTEAGLHFVLRRLESLSAVSITSEGARGTIGGPLSFDRLTIDHDAVRIEVRELHLEPQLGSLLSRTISIARVEAGAVGVTLRKRPPQPPSTPHFMPRPLRLTVGALSLRRVELRLANGQRYAVAFLTGALTMDRNLLQVPAVTLQDPAGQVAGELQLRAAQPLGLSGTLAGHWRLPDDRDYRFSGSVRGDLDRLGTDLRLVQPARLSFSGNALDLTGTPRLLGTLRAIDFDGSPWVPSGRFPALSGSIALDAARDSIGVDGTLTSPAFAAEPLRLQGGGTWRGRVVEIRTLRAWLPRSEASVTVAGSVDLGPESPVLALAGEWSQLRWPLSGDGPPLLTSAQGVYRLGGSLPYAYDVKAETAGAQIPAAAWQASGLVSRDAMTIDALEAYALRGRIRASGRLAWTGPQEWGFTAQARSLDLHELRADLVGQVNLDGSIEGRGFGAEAPWTVRIASLGGTLFGRALTGSGEIARLDGGYELRGVRAVNADSYAMIDGRVGRSLDLALDADLRSLAIVDPRLSGRLTVKARAHGTPARPSIAGVASAAQLRYGTFLAGSAHADIDFDASDASDSRILVQARDVDSGALRFDRIELRGEGRISTHRLSLEFVSPGDERYRLAGFTARVAVRGGLTIDERRWAGELTTTELSFPDGAVTLLQPAALELSPETASAAPICLETGEARLCAEGQWHARPESWRLIYSAQDWPLKRLLTSLLGWREFDGMLQASGWVGKEPGQDWLGGTTILLDQASLDIPRNKFRTERIRLGGGRLDLFAEPERIRTSLALAVGENARIEGQAQADRLPGRPMHDYPLVGQIHGGSEALTALPVFVPEIDRSAGSLEAELVIGGTLGEPLFNGAFEVRDGRFEFYRTNFVLADAHLTGRFEGDELSFDGRGTTSGGAVTLEGRFRWPEGVMNGSMRLTGDRMLVADTPEYRIVASPDLTVTASTAGYVVSGKVAIPSALIAPKDLTTSVSTSPDERIVGIDAEDEAPSTLERVRSRIDVVLGEDVRVDSYGLTARLGGAVTVLTRPADVARGQGAINVVEGHYKAFGQDVRITRGRLSYDNTPLSQPTLDLVAERRIEAEDVTVAVNVRGQLDQPYISITSVPAMSSNEALSYLLTGRSVDTLQSGEVQQLDSAAQSLAVGGGGWLLGGIGSRLGLDEVTVEGSGADDTSVVLGKYLSTKLFVSYGISISEAINTIKLRYTLNSKWSVEAEAGLDQSADLEYRIER
jgi:translocation and assembly module TamB